MTRVILGIGFSFLVLFFWTEKVFNVSLKAQKSSSSSCRIQALSSSSFYEALSELLIKKLKTEFNCDLEFRVVHGANLISNVYLQNPLHYDLLLGLDIYQLERLGGDKLAVLSKNLFNGLVDKSFESLNFQNRAWAYDMAPLTFFIRSSADKAPKLREKRIYEFSHLEDFLDFLKVHKLYVAVPLPTTSVLGTLFVHWVHHHFYNSIKETSNANDFKMDPLKVQVLTQKFLKSKSFKFVKSWSQAFGLFERKIVSGFLSFETSELFYRSKKDVIKVSLKSGHPIMKEYFAFSKKHSLKEKDIQGFLKIIYSSEIQKLMQEKNYMWPAVGEFLKDHEYKNRLNVVSLHPALRSKKLRQLWSQK